MYLIIKQGHDVMPFRRKTSAREIILCQNAQGRQITKLSVSLMKLEIIKTYGAMEEESQDFFL